MQVIIDVHQHVQITALTRATVAYNLCGTSLTEEQFLLMVVDQTLNTYVSMYTKPVLTKFEFLNRFTANERVAIRSAATNNAHLYDFMNMLEVSGEVQLANPATIAGVKFLESVGLLAAGRAVVILEA